MTTLRRSIPDFQLANPIYTGARVTFYTVDITTGLKTATTATLYTGAVGATTASNPQTLDGDGKFPAPVYADVPVIGEVTGLNVGSHATGIIGVRSTWRGAWATATAYFSGDIVQDTITSDLYVVADDHVSGASLAAGVSAGHLILVLDNSVLVGIPLASGIWGPFTDVASAATTNIGGADTIFVDITGVTGVTSLGSTLNRLRVVRTDNAITFTSSASLVAPGGAFTSVAGVPFMAVADETGKWHIFGTGTLAGPAVATDNAIVRFDGGGSTIQNSIAILSDLGALSGLTGLTFAAASVISWNAGDVTITHATNALAFAGASSGYTFDALVTPAANDGAALGSTAAQWSDLFLAEGGVINWDNGDVSITQTNNVLAFAGASAGYTFDAAVVVGHTATLAVGGVTASTEQFGTTLATAAHVIGLFSTTSADFAHLQFYKSANASIGSATVVASGDALGAITFYGAQQTGTFSNSSPAAQIASFVDGTVTSGASGDMPGRLVFSTTPDGSGVLTQRLILDSAGVLKPFANDGVPLGTTALSFSDLFLASGAVINFNAGDVTITHSANLLAFAGASSGYSFDALVFPASNDGAALGTGANSFSDLFLAATGVINWANGGITITESSDLLAFAGAANGYTFDTLHIVGHTASLSIGGNADNAQVYGTTAATGGMALGMFNATAGTAAHFDFYRSKNAAVGSATVVASGDVLGNINWFGAQQTGTFATQTMAAQIRAEVDGTVTSGGSGDMPGRIVFATTADAGAAVTDRLILDSSGILKPNANDGVALGTTSLSFADLFLASGAVINFNAGDVTITHSANTLTFAGASTGYSFDQIIFPATNDGAALGGASNAFSDLFLASGAVINFNAGNYTITHSSGDLAFSGIVTLPNTGLHLLDTNASHDLIIKPGSNITADRTLTVTTGDTDITLDLTDAGSDKLMFWDDSAGAWTALTLPADLVVSGTSLLKYETHGVAASDETTVISTGAAKASFSLPYAFTVVGVYATLNTSSSSGTPTIDINEAGTTILSTKIVIDQSEFTGGSAGYQGTAAGAAVISDASIAAFAQITVDVDVAGTGAKGLKVFIVGYRT